ncbi:nitronate monooxygenase family protein [Mycobacterium xenopi 3993]|nr:nitronate monooxygenase family protein [Mycobacterium xenopi 3993]
MPTSGRGGVFHVWCPSPDVLRRLGAQGILLFITVTSAYEAGVALAAGADGLVVQGRMPAGTAAPSPGHEARHRAAG